jgi:hypothetical protein
VIDKNVALNANENCGKLFQNTSETEKISAEQKKI